MKCLTDGEARELVGQDIEAPIPAEILAHLDACEACAATLLAVSSLSGDEREKWREAICGPPVTPVAGVPSLPDLMATFSKSNQGTVSNGAMDVLAFLEPPLQNKAAMGRLGRYELVEPIGRGGMGVVFRGVDTELGRDVAVKVLSPHLANDASFRERFIREGRAAAAIVHPNVTGIYSIESDGHLPAIVMPILKGRTLKQCVSEDGPMDPETLVSLGYQLASGLAAAHEGGVVHRDIKPSNVIVSEQGHAHITDFGIARIDSDHTLTTTATLGTPAYMSPEQAEGRTPGEKSDLFSLGSTLYFAATGKLAFPGRFPVKVMRSVITEPHVPVSRLVKAFPYEVETVIERLLEKKPRNRHFTAASLADHLRATLAHMREPKNSPRPRRVRRIRKGVSVLVSATEVGGILVLMVLMNVFVIYILPLWLDFFSQWTGVEIDW